MGYTLDLWAVPPGALYRELATPRLDPATVDFASYGPIAQELAPRWREAAATVARAIPTGGGGLGGMLALYVHLVLRNVGTFVGSLDHSSAGGADFRERFLPGPAARLLGLDVVARLVNREIAGLTWSDYPSFGWVSAAELAGPVQRLATVDLAAISDDPDDEDPLVVLRRAARRAVQLGADMVGGYG